MTTPPDHLAIGLTDGTFYGGDPFPAFAWMREHAPAYFDEASGVWGITRYADIKEISKDPDTFSNAGGIRPDSGALPMMIDTDAPEHVRRRRLVSEGFTPRRIRESEEGIRTICDAIIDRVCEAGSADFVRDIAAPLPMIVIGNMLGVAPEDRDDLLRWSDDMLKALGSPEPGAMDKAALAAMEYTEYITAVAEQRRRDNQSDDLIGTLVHAEIDGDRLDESSIIYESLLILIGGDETTRHVISGGMFELLRHPDQLAQARRRPVDAAGGGRGDVAVGVAHQEHGPADDQGRRVRRARPCTRVRSSCCSIRRPTATSGCSTGPTSSTSPGRPTTTWPSASGHISAWATGWPGWSSR